MILVRGQRVKLAQISPSPIFEVALTLNLGGPGQIKVCCLGLDRQKRFSDHRYFIFENQTGSPDGAVRLFGPKGGEHSIFEVNLPVLPSHVQRLIFAAFINGPGALNQLEYGHLRLIRQDKELARFLVYGHDFTYEKAVIMGEFYVHNAEWRLYADGQGFKDGLEAIFNLFQGGAFLETIRSRPKVVVVSEEEIRRLREESDQNPPWVSEESIEGDRLDELRPEPLDDLPPLPPGRRTLH
jgi:stress response protein SCP2